MRKVDGVKGFLGCFCGVCVGNSGFAKVGRRHQDEENSSPVSCIGDNVIGG